MQATIAQHLNVSIDSLLKIEEWKNVLFVVVRGIGGRFVSKKIMPSKKSVTAYSFASEIAERSRKIWTSSTGTLKASVWSKKPGETRVYVKTHKGGDCGFIKVTEKGVVWNQTKSYIWDEVDKVVDEVLEAFEVVEALKASDSLSRAVQEMCWQCGYNLAAFSNGLCVSCVD